MTPISEVLLFRHSHVLTRSHSSCNAVRLVSSVSYVYHHVLFAWKCQCIMSPGLLRSRSAPKGRVTSHEMVFVQNKAVA